MNSGSKIEQAIDSFGWRAVNLALMEAQTCSPGQALTHFRDVGEEEAAKAIELIYF